MLNFKTLGLLGLLGLVSACAERGLIKETPNVRIENQCKIQRYGSSGTPRQEIHAVDTDGDGNFDEVFVTKGYSGLHLGNLTENNVAQVTAHYITSGLPKERQVMTGFPQTETMTDDYQLALQIICNSQ